MNKMEIFTEEIPILPFPRELKRGSEDFIIEKQCLVVVGKNCTSEDLFIIQHFKEELEMVWGYNIGITTSTTVPASKFILLGIPSRDNNIDEYCQKEKIGVSSKIGEQGYILKVDNKKIILIANHNKGLFYGMQTLKQLIKVKGNNLVIQGVEIEDWPILKYRGIQDDISRGPIANLDYFKRMIKICSEYKINMLMFYIEHMFAYEKHPEISPEGALTKDEVKELLDYAKNYYIELVPQQQSLGHFYHILKHPQYKNLAKTPEILDPSKEETYKLLEDMYSEIIPAFDQTENPTQFFHVGCDETFGLDPQLYLGHIKRLHEIVSSYGKTMMIWGDMCLKYPEIIPELPKDIIIMNWAYRDLPIYYYQLFPFQEAKLKQFVCPGVSCWNRIFPNYTVALNNIYEFVRDGIKAETMGMLNATWDDSGENLFEYNWYGIVYSACCSWNVDGVKNKEFTKDFVNTFYKSEKKELVEIFDLLIEINSILSDPFDLAFWIEPFSSNIQIAPYIFPNAPSRIYSFNPDPFQLKEAEKLCRKSIDLILKNEGTVRKNKRNLNYLLFAQNRYLYLIEKKLSDLEIVEKYKQLYQRYKKQPQKEVIKKISSIISILEKKYAELENLKEWYKQLWLEENRQYYLDVILNRYNSLLDSYKKYINLFYQVKSVYLQEDLLPPSSFLELEK